MEGRNDRQEAIILQPSRSQLRQTSRINRCQNDWARDFGKQSQSFTPGYLLITKAPSQWRELAATPDWGGWTWRPLSRADCPCGSPWVTCWEVHSTRHCPAKVLSPNLTTRKQTNPDSGIFLKTPGVFKIDSYKKKTKWVKGRSTIVIKEI